MAPTRATKSSAFAGIFDKLQGHGISRYVTSERACKENFLYLTFLHSKRKADNSPIKNDRIKRSALGNLTNALIATDSDELLKKGALTITSTTKKISESTRKTSQNEGYENNVPVIQPISSRTRAAAKVQPIIKKIAKVTTELLPPPQLMTTDNHSKSISNQVSVITTVKSKAADVHAKATRRISSEFEKTEESLYVSALEDISDLSRLSTDTTQRFKVDLSDFSMAKTLSSESLINTSPEELKRVLPKGVEDFDKENWNDPYQVSNYAMDIFDYLKERETDYKIKDYMTEQPELSKWMRSLLVDWMVEVQESFELNHETLYLAVKIVDTYLGKERVVKDNLQLLGAASLLIACKYDVRSIKVIK